MKKYFLYVLMAIPACSKHSANTRTPAETFSITIQDSTGASYNFAETLYKGQADGSRPSDFFDSGFDVGVIPLGEIKSMASQYDSYDTTVSYNFSNMNESFELQFSVPFFQSTFSIQRNGPYDSLSIPDRGAFLLVMRGGTYLYNPLNPYPFDGGPTIGTAGYKPNSNIIRADVSTVISDSSNNNLTGSFHISAYTLDGHELKISVAFQTLPIYE